MQLFDAHNHLQDEWLEPHLAVVLRERPGLGITRMVVNGTHPDDWSRVAELAREHPWVQPCFGLHPWQCGRRPADWRERFEAAFARMPRAHVGEIGIDRWILEQARPGDPRLADTTAASFEEQLECFTWQYTWATRHDRTPTVHCLNAWGPLLETLSALPRSRRGLLLHAYGGSIEMAARFAELGASFSFSPSFLAARKARLQEVFRVLPLDRLLVETDAPAMPPPAELSTHPLPDAVNGVRVNSPSHLPLAYGGLARLRGLETEALADQVERNFLALFG